jgi:hypothetical protein
MLMDAAGGAPLEGNLKRGTLLVIDDTSGRKLLRVVKAHGEWVRVERLRAVSKCWTQPQRWRLDVLQGLGLRVPDEADRDLLRTAEKAR